MKGYNWPSHNPNLWFKYFHTAKEAIEQVSKLSLSVLLILLNNHCYETNSQKNRKDRSPYNSVSLRGQTPLHYTNEKFLDDTNDKTSFLYIGV